MRISMTMLSFLVGINVSALAEETMEHCVYRDIGFPQCDKSFADAVIDPLDFEINVARQSI